MASVVKPLGPGERGGSGGEAGGVGGADGAEVTVQPGMSTAALRHEAAQSVEMGALLSADGANGYGQPEADATEAYSDTLAWHTPETLPKAGASACRPIAQLAPPRQP